MSRRARLAALAGVLTTVAMLAGCGSAPSLPSPYVFEVAPTVVHVGDTLVIDGQAFGDLQASGFVTVRGVTADVAAWSDARIEVAVPDVPVGDTVVVVTQAGHRSPPVDLTVAPSS